MPSAKTLRAVIELAGKVDPSLVASMKTAEGRMRALKTVGKVAAGALAAGAVATAKVMKTSVDKSTKYQTAYAKTQTLLADGTDVDKYSSKLLKASTQSGVAATDLTETVYQAISAGQKQGKAIEFSVQAAKLAKGGFTDSATAVDIMTTALNAYGKSSGLNAEKVSDLLVTTQNLGKTTVAELAGSMGKVIPTAKATGTSMENLSTAYALLTKNGVKTRQAGTYTNALLNELGKSSTTVAKTLKKETGKSFSQLQGEGKNLNDVLQILYKSAGGDADRFGDMWSSSNAKTAALTLKDSKQYNEILQAMGKSSGTTAKAAGTMGNTYQGALNKMKNAWNNVEIELGNKLVPIMTDVAETVLPVVQEKATDLIDSLGDIDLSEVAANVGDAATGLVEMLGDVDLGQLVTDAAKLGSQSFEGVERLVTTVSEHSGEVKAGAVAMTALGTGFALFKGISTVAGGMTTISTAASKLAGKGGAAGAGLAKMAAGEAQAGAAAGTSATNMLKMGGAVLMVGGGVALAAAGIALVAQSAIAVSQAGPGAGQAMALMAVGGVAAAGALAGIGTVAAGAAPGVLALGAGVLMVGAGIGAASAGMSLLAAQFPTVAAYAPQVASALMAASPAIVAFGTSSLAAAPGVAALAAASAPAAVAVGALGAASLVYAGGVTAAMAGTSMLAGALPAISGASPMAAAGLAQVGTASMAAAAGMAPFAGLAAGASAAMLVLAGGAAAYAAGITLAVPGTVVLSASLPALAMGAQAAAPALTALAPATATAAPGLSALGAAALAAAPGIVAVAAGSTVLAGTVTVMAATLPIAGAGMQLMSSAAGPLGSALLSAAPGMTAFGAAASGSAPGIVAASGGMAVLTASTAGFALVAMPAAMAMQVMSSAAPGLGPALMGAVPGMTALAAPTTALVGPMASAAASTASMSASLSGASGGAYSLSGGLAAASGSATVLNASLGQTHAALGRARAGFSSFVGSVSSAMSSAVSRVQSAMSSIASACSRHFTIGGFSVGPLPHFSMSGDFNAKSKSVPSVSVSWYAAGGHVAAMRSGGDVSAPTVIAVAGEAGPETVISYDPRYRSANVGYWLDAGQRLGVLGEFAGGGEVMADGVSRTARRLPGTVAGMPQASPAMPWLLDPAFGTGLESAATAASGATGGGIVIDMGGVTFAPTVNVTGSGDSTESDVMQQIRDAEPEFVDMLDEWLREKMEEYDPQL